ncbi:MAG: type IX secretion system membrane protein PorP/SprF [Bacteroidales bacterium]|nr:type IX secretion system membrane protein PorP/SprF [Bacteroidales bacterium]
MKRSLFLLIFLYLSLKILISQQLPLYSQYFLNSFLLNPAIAGSSEYLPVVLTVRQQWLGFKDAPSTQALSAHIYSDVLKIGYGGFFFNDKYGPLSRTGCQFNFAYHMPLHNIESKMSVGLGIKLYQYKYDQTSFIPIEKNDPALSYNLISQWCPESDFGLYFYGKKHFLSLSIANILQYKIDFKAQNVDKNYIVRHVFFLAGYKIDAGEKFAFEPSLFGKITFNSPNQFDFNLKCYYKSDYWAGISYRTSNDLVIVLGAKVGSLFFGYSFDYSFYEIKKYCKGSHEITLGYNILEKKKYEGSRLL